MNTITLLFGCITIIQNYVCFCQTNPHKFLGNVNSHTCLDIPAVGEGEGLYRDPVDILGKCFRPEKTALLCESEMILYADEVKAVRFTARGKKLCDDVCRTYQKTMILSNDVGVQLLKTSCNYIGSEDGTEKIGLSKKCNCPYEIQCRQQTQVMTYTFQPNCDGFLKVALFKNKFHHYIT